MGTPLRDPNFEDSRAAALARLIFAPIDVEVFLRFARRAIGLAIPIHARALVLDPGVERGADGGVEGVDLRRR